jgi:hypothetical protein
MGRGKLIRQQRRERLCRCFGAEILLERAAAQLVLTMIAKA